MDAVEFLNKIDRLSQIGSTGEKIRYTDYRTAGDNVGAVKFVERWAAEHPGKTRQSVFLEQWPDAQLDSCGIVEICPSDIDTTIHQKCSADKCGGCRREFWLAEVDDGSAD